MLSKGFFLLLFINTYHLIYAQPESSSGNSKVAKDNFSLGNYRGAIEEYLQIFKTDSISCTNNYRLGVSYLNTNIDKSKAIKYLLKAASDPKCDNKVHYELGRAYLLNYQLVEAIASFKKYKEITSGNESYTISSDRQIQMCEEAKKQINSPQNVIIENVGSEINTAYPDYFPFAPNDESFLTFSSKRPGNTGNLMDFDGLLTSDVYLSIPKYNMWTKAKNAGGLINSDLIEETCGISSDGKTIFLQYDNYMGYNDIWYTEKKGKSLTKPSSLGKSINTSKVETSATISKDNKTLFFSCDKNSEYGGMDIYFSRKLPSGEWSAPENIGEVVNSVYDEDFPYMATDGKTLYFCSNGHNSMGGFDIFKTTWNEKENKWNKPENMGYPINTTDDDFSICITANGRHAFISSFRKGGSGDLDIYRVIFNDVEPALTAHTISLINKDSVNIFSLKPYNNDSISHNSNKKINSENTSLNPDPIPHENILTRKAKISCTDADTKKIVGIYNANKKTGNFTMILPPGNYILEVEVYGYKKFSDTLKVNENAYHNFISKDIVLTTL